MARRVMPIGEFVRLVIEESFRWSEEFFGPIREDKKTQNINFAILQLTDGPPERFLHLLETTEDPKQVVEEAVARLKGFSPPYQIQTLPGEFLKERFNEAMAMQTIGHLIAFIFGGPESGSRFSGFSNDLRKIYAFLKQKFEASLADSGGGPDEHELGDTKIDLREKEKEELILNYSSAVFSIHLLIKKISKQEVNCGQYL